MSVQYQLRVFNRSGTLLHIITDMLGLAYVREVNSPGILNFDLPSNHIAIDDFDTDVQVEVWRQDLAIGLTWYRDFTTFWRGEQRRADSDGNSRYTANCVGVMDLLRRVIIAYPAGTANRSDFSAVAAETIAKTLVSYNLVEGTASTGDGRARSCTITGVTVESDAGTGNSLTMRCAWRNLLETLKDVAELGGGDYDIVRIGPAGWQFQWHNGQLGTDRTSSVRFALNYGNMSNPQLRRDFSREPTVAIVGGSGSESSRSIAIRTGTNYHPSYNATEMFVDARDATTTAQLNSAGDVELSRSRMTIDISFDVLQVPQTYYGLHYTLGDLVRGVYEGFSATKQVWRVSVSVSENGSEQIYVDLTDV